MRTYHASLAATALLCAVGACSLPTTAAQAPPPATVTVTQPAPPPASSATRSAAPSAANSDGCFASYQTTQANVRLCRESGQIYYHGSSSSGSINLPATAIAAGTYQTVPSNGYTYTISPIELAIRHNAAVVSEQPVIPSSGESSRASSGGTSATETARSGRPYTYGTDGEPRYLDDGSFVPNADTLEDEHFGGYSPAPTTTNSVPSASEYCGRLYTPGTEQYVQCTSNY